jgi:4-hydroxythreonine-4-phosphate dehydrogenase
VLVVVGSRAPLSRLQAAVLATTKEIAVVTLRPEGLLAGPGAQEWREDHYLLTRALGEGRDVLTVLGAGDMGKGDMAPDLCRALSGILAPCRACIGALVLTGGETAREVLTGFGVRFLVPIREVEPGVALALASTENGERLPVITKAGAFGEPETLVHCRAALTDLLR